MTAPLLSWYGDDFTGSTDVLEALASRGIPSVLFTRLPTEEERAAFPHARAIGLAGDSRSRAPEWMDAQLPGIFAWLRGLGAGWSHYKVCSTFDSAPHQGSIGRALDLGLAAFGQRAAPVLVGAPQLRRWTYLGHLFAAYQGVGYRIDRHPVMSRHPATPMAESDLLRHLAAQTDAPLALLEPCGPSDADPVALFAASAARGVLIDVHDLPSQARAGEALHRGASVMGPFIVGSSGVEYALLDAWIKAGVAPGRAAFARPAKLDRIVAASGSCSLTTGRQIDAACADGFVGVAVDHGALASGVGAEAACAAALAAASDALEAGRSAILYTANGPDGLSAQGGADRAGAALGRMLDTLIRRHALPRAVLAGGDTSSHAVPALGIAALTLRHPIAQSPGSPLCNAHRGPGDAPLEIALKGGQIGGDDYFIRLRDGALD